MYQTKNIYIFVQP